MIEVGALPLPADFVARVPDESYAGLLGYPRGKPADGRAAELAAASRDWYARHGDPWAHVATVEVEELGADDVRIDGGRRLVSAELARRLAAVSASTVVIAVVSAGERVDDESARRWTEERPDEAYFLDRFGATVAIQLGRWVGSTLRERAVGRGEALAPGYSPGYDGWHLRDQVTVAAALGRSGPPLPSGFRVHDSGMLEPKSSLLAVFGLGRDHTAAKEAWERHPCSWCSLSGCDLRGIERS